MPLLRTLLVAGAVLAADQITKALALAYLHPDPPVPVLGPLLVLRLVRNPGAAYGLLTGQRWLLSAVALAFAAGALWYSRRARGLTAVALGLLVGGALGNAIDRLRFGQVTDMIEIPPLTFVFQVFNVADVAVTFGVLALAWDAWREERDRS